MTVTSPHPRTSIVQVGRNAWVRDVAHEVAILIDGEAYFSAVARAIRMARQTLLIVAWDLDPETPLVQDPETGEWTTLWDALQEALASSPELEVFIVCWDFAMVYSLETRFFAKFQRLSSHPRIHFAIDGKHPFGACHHEKLVIVDEQIAFCGGLDLYLYRWDTSDHLSMDPRRRTPSGIPYSPFHDLQVAVTGPVAASLARLAKQRWREVVGSEPKSARALHRRDFGLEPQFRDIRVAVSRTRLGAGPDNDRHEVEALYVDSIRAAKSSVYVECEYFTSDRIAEAIVERLQEPDGPEFVVLTALKNSGPIERYTMGVLRDRVIERVLSRDPHGHAAFYFPVSTNDGKPVPITVHAKLMIVDDRLLRIGSSNLSNRSMGFDTECDLAIEADARADIRDGIADIRLRLLSEHLGAGTSKVAASLERAPSLIGAVEELRRIPGRKQDLLPFVKLTPKWLDRVTPDAGVLDPSHPVDEDPYFSRFIPKDSRLDMNARSQFLAARLGFITGFSLLLGSSPVKTFLTRAPIWNERHPLKKAAGSSVYFILGTGISIPADVLVFSLYGITGKPSLLYSLLGFGISPLFYYSLGRFSRSWKNDPSTSSHEGFWAGFILHSALLRGYPRLAIHAGALRIPVQRFLAGTMTAHVLRTTAIWLYFATLRKYVKRPNASSFVSLTVASVGVIALYRWWSRRFLPRYGYPSGRPSWT